MKRPQGLKGSKGFERQKMESALLFKHAGLNEPGRRRGIVIFSVEVTDKSVAQLLDLLESAFNYYQYKEVEIQVNSPGGSVRALHFLLDHFERYRNQGRVLALTALMEAASAAALMVSCGTPGRRAAYPRAVFLYHSVRLPEVKELTEIKAKRYFEDMQRENEFARDLLVHMALCAQDYFLKASGHKEDFFLRKLERFQKTAQELDLLTEEAEAKDLIQKERFEALVRGVYGRLLQRESFLTAEQAKDLFLIDRVGTR